MRSLLVAALLVGAPGVARAGTPRRDLGSLRQDAGGADAFKSDVEGSIRRPAELTGPVSPTMGSLAPARPALPRFTPSPRRAGLDERVVPTWTSSAPAPAKSGRPVPGRALLALGLLAVAGYAGGKGLAGILADDGPAAPAEPPAFRPDPRYARAAIEPDRPRVDLEPLPPEAFPDARS